LAGHKPLSEMKLGKPRGKMGRESRRKKKTPPKRG
jgi:hypothetical protein